MPRTATSSSDAGRPPRIVLVLGWAGLLPFAACALLAWQPALASRDAATAGVLFAGTAGSVRILMLVFWLLVAFEWAIGTNHGWYMRYRLQLTTAVTLLLLIFLAAPDIQ